MAWHKTATTNGKALRSVISTKMLPEWGTKRSVQFVTDSRQRWLPVNPGYAILNNITV